MWIYDIRENMRFELYGGKKYITLGWRLWKFNVVWYSKRFRKCAVSYLLPYLILTSDNFQANRISRLVYLGNGIPYVQGVSGVIYNLCKLSFFFGSCWIYFLLVSANLILLLDIVSFIFYLWITIQHRFIISTTSVHFQT